MRECLVGWIYSVGAAGAVKWRHFCWEGKPRQAGAESLGMDLECN